jgi:hypothetical protein
MSASCIISTAPDNTIRRPPEEENRRNPDIGTRLPDVLGRFWMS